MKNLVIVESPAKAKTIEKFLGKDYKVMSSYGHIRDLRKKDFSIDIDKDFEPIYEIPADKKDLVKQLKTAAKQADTVWLASDEDREGEAIAWHLYEVLGLKPQQTRRIVFHEITKPAILNAIQNPRDIDIDRVNAQQARRVLDRIVGFELSPVLWKKIMPALSAGRVQSVAVRLICERENEVRNFTPESFFRINAIFRREGDDKNIKAELQKRFSSEDEGAAFLKACRYASYTTGEITIKPLHRSPAPPFTTSTLQQAAARELGFPVYTTMRIAQKLYEDGRITYMRTDSLNLSNLALADIASAVKAEYGDEYSHTRKYHTNSKGAQEAHEAIRPTYIKNRTIEGTPQEKRLYDLIWRRTVASQMADAMLEKTTVEINISDRDEKFEAQGEVMKFPGFMALNPESSGSADDILPHLDKGEALDAIEIKATERFTMPPARYSEGSLVKKMEDLGIGRPSTYAPTISTIQERKYVERGEKEGIKRNYVQFTLDGDRIERKILSENTGSEKGKLIPTDIGMVVNEFLTKFFPDILDYNFTAKVEEKFDEIAEGDLTWKKEIAYFYENFHPEIDKINTMRMEHKVGERLLGTDPKSGKPVSVKIGRYGPIVQIGDASDEEKPRFASLRGDQSVSTITLEEALKLFDLPRSLGKNDEGKEIVASVGRFGPYVKLGSTFVSIPKDLAPETITLQEALELIKKKAEADAQKHIKSFPEKPGLEVLNGRFGPYIAYKPEGAKKAVNYKIPKSAVPADLTLEEAEKIMAEQDSAPKKTTRRRTTKAK